MTKQRLIFNEEARKKLASGADQLAKAVISTLGPRSRNVAIAREFPGPLVVHDGVSVAGSIRLQDPFEDMGAVLLREAASTTNSQAGDGTTTSILLANTLLQEGMKMMSGVSDGSFVVGDVNPMELRDELKAYGDKIVAKIKERTVPADTHEKIQQVATISAGSAELGSLVADAVDKAGKTGVIMVEVSEEFESSIEVHEGMEFDNGWLSAYFSTNPRRLETEYQDSYVLITDQNIADPQELVPIIEAVKKDGGKPLLIIAGDVVGEALSTLVTSKLKGLRVVAVVAPEFADRRKQALEDIAILTGGNVISSDLGKRVSSATLGDLGRLKSMRITNEKTSFIPKNPDTEEIKERVESIRTQLKESPDASPLLKNSLEDRLAKLTNGVVIVKVGGPSGQERVEKKERVIDAVNATKGAVDEGMVAGAGMTLFFIGGALDAEATEDEKKKPSFQLIQKVLRTPFEMLMLTSGFDSVFVLEAINHYQEVMELEKKKLPSVEELIGWNVVTGTVVPLIEAGIVDPSKVTSMAVLHAISVATTMLTTNTLVADIDEPIQKMKVMQ